MKFKSVILFLLTSIITFSSVTYAQLDNTLPDLFSDEPDFLPVDEAFIFDFQQQQNKLVISWQIADGYYLYKKQMKTATNGASVSEPNFPPAKQIEDEYFGISDVYYQALEINYEILSAEPDSTISIRYQGCASAGLCYPPTTKTVYLAEVIGKAGEALSAVSTTKATPEEKAATGQSQQFDLVDKLTSGDSLAVTLFAFLILGIGLAFTPCVFPMYPILSSIVIGQGKSISLSKGFTLSFIYVQGMAITYSILGLIVASVGVRAQAWLQDPAVLITMIVLFIVLAFVMFGAYELQLPSKWQEKLNSISNNQKGGSLGGVFLMGVISGLVASPCTTAPLTGILLYIAQSGDLVLGFFALYVLSLGMGIPLILFGMTGGKLLPKAGNWMNIVKTAFGFGMLAVAMMFVERMVDNVYTQVGWGLLGFATFTYFYVMNQNTPVSIWKGIRTFIIFLGLILSFTYGYSAFAPQQAEVVYVNTQNGTGHGNSGNASGKSSAKAHPEFVKVNDLAEFEKLLAKANNQGKRVMIDLYADWCVACKEFEKYTFPDPAVIEALDDFIWMQIDLTDVSDTTIEFQEEFSVLGLPTILFFGTDGQEQSNVRVTGFLKAEPFAAHVNNNVQ
jgi:thiol:disulfide interchange protein DsbD